MKQNTAAKQPNQTLAKAIEVLDAFSTEHSEWGIRELARELDINPTTVYRIVRTLCNKGYLEQDNIKQTYSLGPRVLKLANLYNYHNPLSEVAKKVFESYSIRFEHAFYLGMLSGFEVIYLATVNGKAPLTINIEPGYSLPLHSNALGKVLLAYEGRQYIQEFLRENPLTEFTPRTLSNPQNLLQQLEEIQRQGYAINDGEQFDAIGAVAVHLSLPEKQMANLAVSLTYPRHLVNNGSLNVDDLIALGQEIAREIRNRSNV